MTSALRGGFRLGIDTGRAIGIVGLDALRAPFGSALPDSPEEVATPEFIGRLLGRPVRAVRLPGVDFESSNCRNFLIEVEGMDGSLQSMYVKMPASQVAPRVFANTVGYWALECTFCEQVAEHVPVRVPQVYAVAHKGSRFVLLLENIQEIPGVTMFINRDTAAGTSVEQARRCLSAFAEMHAVFHGWDTARREAVLPLAQHVYLSDRGRAVTQALNKVAIDRAHNRAPEMISAELRALYRRTLEHWDTMLDHWYSGPLTLVHGDSHLANCFEYDDESGNRKVGFLDFQGVHWSKGIRDVAYFLINSLDVDLIGEIEDELIDHYLTELASHGVVLERAETKRHYRSFAFQALAVGVVAVGLGGFTESENTVETMLRRQVAAMDRLGFSDLLDELTG